MTDFYEFLANNWLLTTAWTIVAVLLLSIHFRLVAQGPQSIGSQMLTHYVNREEGVVVDVRGQADFNKGHIQGALNIPLSKIKDSVKELEKYKNKPMIMVCANGIQVASACQTLKKEGFSKLHKLSGGMTSWQGDNLPIVK